MGNAVIKGFRIADTQELCFEAWKRLHMGCAALLFVRFSDVEELRLKPEKRQ